MRKGVFFSQAFVLTLALGVLGVSLAARQGDPEAAKIKNPVASTSESIAAGKKAYDLNCAGCHGPKAEGADKAGIVLSVIEDQGGRQPPDLTDDTWDHGASDGEIFNTIKKGVGPQFFMAPWDGRIPDADIWNTINYIKSLAKKKG
jgi:mono/diheme cytochrome c family protein